MNVANVKSQLAAYGLSTMWNDQDPLLTTYEQIAASHKTTAMHAGDFISTAIACQIARHILYKKKTPGDCPMQTSYKIGPGMVISKAAGIAGLGASTVAETAGLVGASIGAGAAEAASVIGLVALPFTVWGAFEAHHAAAVAKEQATLCEIVSAINPSFDQMDAMVQSGQISASDYIANIEQLRKQAQNAYRNSGVYQNCNAACYLSGYTDCVIDLRKILYQQSSSGSGPGTAPSATSVASGLVQSNGVFTVGIAAVAAKLTGVI